MKELDEIMKGKIKLKHFNIDNDTISFQTELDNYMWNLTPRDIEIIISNLQEKIDKAIDKVHQMAKVSDGNKDNNFKKIYLFSKDEMELLSILEGSDKE